MTLILSLPVNIRLWPELRLPADDMVKTHIHLKHQASGTGFGSLEEERQRFLVSGAVVSVGLVIGAETAMRWRWMKWRAWDLPRCLRSHLPAWMMAEPVAYGSR